MGLEPTTSAVTGRRSNQLNYQAIGFWCFPQGCTIGHLWKNRTPRFSALTKVGDGGSYRARTYDPLLVRQMLSQLSYDPIKHAIYNYKL